MESWATLLVSALSQKRVYPNPNTLFICLYAYISFSFSSWVNHRINSNKNCNKGSSGIHGL